jgi:hypothetical protein
LPRARATKPLAKIPPATRPDRALRPPPIPSRPTTQPVFSGPTAITVRKTPISPVTPTQAGSTAAGRSPAVPPTVQATAPATCHPTVCPTTAEVVMAERSPQSHGLQLKRFVLEFKEYRQCRQRRLGLFRNRRRHREHVQQPDSQWVWQLQLQQ